MMMTFSGMDRALQAVSGYLPTTCNIISPAAAAPIGGASKKSGRCQTPFARFFRVSFQFSHLPKERHAEYPLHQRGLGLRGCADLLAANRYAIGSAAFIDTTEQRLAGRRSGRAQDRDLALPRATLGIERIDEAVAAHYGVSPLDVANCRSGERGEVHRGGTCLPADGPDPAVDRRTLRRNHFGGGEQHPPPTPPRAVPLWRSR